MTGFGLFVELTDVYVTGLVHISTLPGDYYHYDSSSQRLMGEHTSRRFQLGDGMTVRVVRVDLDEKTIDFELSDAPSSTRQGRRRGASREALMDKPKPVVQPGGNQDLTSLVPAILLLGNLLLESPLLESLLQDSLVQEGVVQTSLPNLIAKTSFPGKTVPLKTRAMKISPARGKTRKNREIRKVLMAPRGNRVK